jgi:hypothetical protein
MSYTSASNASIELVDAQEMAWELEERDELKNRNSDHCQTCLNREDGETCDGCLREEAEAEAAERYVCPACTPEVTCCYCSHCMPDRLCVTCRALE